MTEFAITKRAKEYMDKLAQGVDPISGAKVSGDSVLNQERLSHCFTYVSGVLRNTLEDELVRKRRVEIRTSFLSPGVLSRMSYSEEPLSVSQFLERINDLWDPDTTKKIGQNTVMVWLVREGYLESQPKTSGKLNFLPTKLGETIGLSACELSQENGNSYVSIVFSKAAQHFVADHLDQIIALYQASWDLVRISLTTDLLNRIPYSAEPLKISQLMERINSVLEPISGKRIPAVMVTDWLLYEGFLENSANHKIRYPTKRGNSIGLSENTAPNGKSPYTLYNEAAQHFVADHLDQIIAERQSLKKKHMADPEKLLNSGVLKQFPYSAAPLTVRDLVDRINSTAYPVLQINLPSHIVTDWLFQKGFLEQGTKPNGTKMRVPTKQGENIGLSIGQKNDIVFLLYNENAQHFILDHIDQIILSYQSE